MEPVLAIVVGILFAISVFLFLSRSYVRVVLGIFMLSNATHLLIFTAGRLTRDAPPIIGPHEYVQHEEIATVTSPPVMSTSFAIWDRNRDQLCAVCFRVGADLSHLSGTRHGRH